MRRHCKEHKRRGNLLELQSNSKTTLTCWDPHGATYAKQVFLKLAKLIPALAKGTSGDPEKIPASAGMTLRLRMTFTSLFLLLFILPTSASANSVNLTRKLLDRNELVLATQKVRPFLVDRKVKKRLNSWLTHSEIRNYIVECQFRLRPYFQSRNILGPLCYYLRQDDKEKRAKFFDFVERYVLETKLALAEISADPRYSRKDKSKAYPHLKHFRKKEHLETIKQCFAPAMKTTYPSDGSISYSPFGAVSSCFHEKLPKIEGKPFFALNLAEEFPNHPGHVISETSWVGGNEVTYLTKNTPNEDLALKLSEKFLLMRTLYPLDGAGSLESFLSKNHSEVFTEEEGFFSIDNHPVWSEQNSIFGEIKKTIDSAKETIFIDIFFLGNTMGAALAKHLVHLVETKPKLKILMLRDNINHFGHEKEMRPVYNFLLSYSMRNPRRLVIAEALIEEHKSGLPPIMQPILTDAFLEKSGIQKHLSLYGRAVSDHSKVVVVDAKTSEPVALVGSKNWTDGSGAVCYDEVVKIKGAGAVIVQDDYYFDMFYALKKKMPRNYVVTLAKQGWAKGKTTGIDSMIAAILKPFDLLDRDENNISRLSQKIEVPSYGEAVLRTGMNNFDSTRTNAIDEVIQLILFAEKNIFIKDQFLFDRNVVLALIKAKKKNPELDIRAILDPLETTDPAGLPNLLYLDVLAEVGIQVKWKTLHVGWSENALEHSHNIHMEYHMKTISADGKFVISGSANKDQTTMYGSFRGEQVEILDTVATGIHDEAFLKEWNDPSETSEVFAGYNFEGPEGLKGFDGKPLEPLQFIKLIRNIISILFDSQTLS